MKLSKYIKISSIVIFVALLLGVTYLSLHSNKPINKVVMHTFPALLDGSVHDNLKKASLAVIGKVVSEKTYDDNGVVFTDYSLQIDKIIKSKDPKPTEITVSLTGGIVKGTEYVVEGGKLLSKDDTYLFFLNKRFPDEKDSNLYCPAYYGEGVIKVNSEMINGKKEYKGVEFNQDNKFESNLIGKYVESELSDDLK